LSKCKQCGKPMNPVEAMLSSSHGVCGKCTRENHAKATGEKPIEEILKNKRFKH